MEAATLEGNAKQLRARIESQLSERRSLILAYLALRFRGIAGSFPRGIRWLKLQSRRISDRLVVGRWFHVLCVPISLSAACFVVCDILHGSRSVSLATGGIVWAATLAALTYLLLVGTDRRTIRDFEKSEQLSSELWAQIERLAEQLSSTSGRLATDKIELSKTIQQLKLVRKRDHENQILQGLMNQNWKAMRGVEFERYLKAVFQAQGYRVEMTPTTGDQGVDLLVARDGVRIAIQVKGYANSVGNAAIQQVFAGMTHYRCQACAVITNSRFTSSAVSLAKSTNCFLVGEWNFRNFVIGRIQIHSCPTR